MERLTCIYTLPFLQMPDFLNSISEEIFCLEHNYCLWPEYRHSTTHIAQCSDTASLLFYVTDSCYSIMKLELLLEPFLQVHILLKFLLPFKVGHKAHGKNSLKRASSWHLEICVTNPGCFPPSGIWFFLLLLLLFWHMAPCAQLQGSLVDWCFIVYMHQHIMWLFRCRLRRQRFIPSSGTNHWLEGQFFDLKMS